MRNTIEIHLDEDKKSHSQKSEGKLHLLMRKCPFCRAEKNVRNSTPYT